MRRYLLDTGIAGDYSFRRHDVHLRVRDAFLRGDIIGICYPVLGELWAGMELSVSRQTNVPRMKHALAKLRNWPFERQAAEEYGKVFAELRQRGENIQQVDMQSRHANRRHRSQLGKLHGGQQRHGFGQGFWIDGGELGRLTRCYPR